MPVKLTDYEERMLRGEFGTARQVALEKIIQYAEILGAEELVEVTKAHLCCGSPAVPADFPDGDLTKGDFLEREFDDWHVKKKCQELPPGAFQSFYEGAFVMDDVHCCDSFQWEFTQQTPEFFQNNRQIVNQAAEHGAVVGSTCAPYLAGWIPLMGEYFVTTESSNVLFCNSIWGARGNGGGGSTTFLSAVCGRAPKWGLHLDENRHGTHVFHIRCNTGGKLEWDLLGMAVGRRLAPNAIPVLCGDIQRPDMVKLKTFFTSLATASGCEMCLIVGVSPEAQTYEMAMKGHSPLAEYTITDEMIEGIRKEICHPVSGPVDFLQIGCPNCSCEELQRVARYMRGKKVKEGVRFCIFTNIAQYGMAQASHIVESLHESGVEVLTSGCILRTINLAKGAKAIGLSAAKLAHYSKTEREVPVYYGTDEQVMDAAVSGYWKVES